MANGKEWTEALARQGWIDENGTLVSPGEAILRVMLPQGRNFNIRTGKVSAHARIEGEFLIVQENNVDSAGRARITAVALTAVESIDSLS